MSNKKSFRKAQEAVPGPPQQSSVSGFLNIEAVCKSLKGSQAQPCDPYKTMIRIAENLKVSPKKLYFKVLRYDTRGNVHLRVMNSYSSGNSGAKQYIIVANILSEIVMKTTRLNRSSSKKRGTKSIPSDRSERKRSSKRSYRSRKTSSRTRRSRLYRRPTPRVALKDQIVVKDTEVKLMAQPTDFNTPMQNMPKKDFASIFESANNKLYSDEPEEVIEIETPPGVAKYVGLGIDVDRPSIISSTELNKIIYDDSLDVFEQMVLERELRLQAIFDNLELVDEADVTKLLEVQATIELLTNNAIDSVSKIAKVDEQIINDISISIFDQASSLGFKDTELLTRVYIQAAFDLGAVSEVGPFNFQGTHRELASIGNSINIDLNRSPGGFNLDYIKSGMQALSINETKNYNIGKFGNLLSFQSTENPPEFNGANWDADRSLLSNRIANEDTAIMMQLVYTELALSKLYTSGDANVIALKDKGTINIAEMFLGDLALASVDLNSVDVPTGLASVVKYNSGGVNYYPLESDIPTAGGISGRTFLDAVVQPAIGALIEDEDPNFDLLNAWVENSRANLSTFFKYSDVLYDQGGSTIILNEILMTLVDFLTDPNKKIGSKSHPFSNSMSRFDGSLNALQLVAILKYFFKNAGYEGKSSILYNTFGHCTHPENIEITKHLRVPFSVGAMLKTTVTSIQAGDRLSISASDNYVRVPNNFYEESSRFCNLLENGIMNSIDLLLSDSGMLRTTVPLDYGIASQGFFVDQTVIGKEAFTASSGSDATASPASPHACTAFSGIPKITIRKLLANICYNVLAQIFGTTSQFPAIDSLLDDDSKNLLKLSKLAVENLDSTLGPVRWKVTHGQWPPESGDFSDITDDVFNKLVPSDIKEALETGSLEASIDFDDSVEITNPLEGWEFLESKEDYCPITLMLDGEDNSRDKVSFVKANRNLADSTMQQLVNLRSSCFKMRHLLESPLTAFENFPATVEQVASSLSFDSIKELAQLPSIDGQEIVKFASPIQISSAKKSLMLETPSPSLRYLPNKYAISKDEYAVARSMISKYTEDTFERQDKALIHTLGIPAGYLSSENLVNEQFSLTRNASYMFFPTMEFEPKETIYHASVYLVPGSFSNCDSEASFDSNVLNTKFYIAAEGIYRLMEYSDAIEYLASSDAETILRNHVIDYSLYLILKITTGIEFSEDTFRLNKLANERYVSADSAKEIPNLIKKVPSAYEDIIKEDKVDDFRDAVKVFDDLTIPEINLYLGSLDCRLLSPEMIAKQALSPRIFDRVFNMLTHPNDHYIDQPRSNNRMPALEYTSFKINGESKTGYRIALKDGSSNKIRNDHFAEYSFMVEK